MGTGICDLPCELIVCISHHLDYHCELWALCSVSTWFYDILNRILYKNPAHRRYALRWAVSHGVEATARRLLEAGVDPDGPTVLLAAAGGHGDILQLLRDHGFDWNAEVHPDSWSDGDWPSGAQYVGTALTVAARAGQESVVRLLLEHRDPGLDDSQPIHRATLGGHVAVVRQLLDHASKTGGGGGGGRPFNSNTLLYSAVVGRKTEVVRLLLERASHSEIPFRAAVANDDQRTFLVLLQYQTPPDAQLLFYATSLGLLDIVQDLVTKRDYLQVRDKVEQGFLLCAAAGCGFLDLVTDMLSSGWDADGPPVLGFSSTEYDLATPLSWAAKNDHMAMVNLLLSHGAHADIRRHVEDLGLDPGLVMDPLRVAVHAGHESIVAVLLEHGSDPNVSYFSMPLLQLAVGSESMFRLLLNAGADPRRIPSPDYLVRDIIEDGDAGEVRALLEKGFGFPQFAVPLTRGRRYVPSLDAWRLIASFSPQIINIMRRHGFDPRHVYDGHHEILVIVAYASNTFLLQLLISSGFYARHPLLNKQIELLHAAAAGDDRKAAAATLDLLLSHGLSLGAQDTSGRTVLHRAVSRVPIEAGWDCSHGHAVSVLLERGADPLFRPFRGESAFTLAARSGKLEILKDILDNLDAWGVPFAQLEDRLRSAQRTAMERGQPAVLKELRRYYWRKRYPV